MRWRKVSRRMERPPPSPRRRHVGQPPEDTPWCSKWIMVSIRMMGCVAARWAADQLKDWFQV